MAKLIQKYGLLALPVVDDDNVLLGIVTVDDAMIVVEEETTEDILKLAGSNVDESIDLGQVSIWARAKRRLPWILIAIAGEIVSGRVINDFSAALQTIVTLSLFIPVIMDMGGNVGTQSAAIMVRGLATGELESLSIAKKCPSGSRRGNYSGPAERHFGSCHNIPLAGASVAGPCGGNCHGL